MTASLFSPEYDAAVPSLWVGGVGVGGHRKVGEEETWNKSCVKVFHFAPSSFSASTCLRAKLLPFACAGMEKTW